MSYVIREPPLIISSPMVRQGVLMLLRYAEPRNRVVYVGLIDDPIEDVAYDIAVLNSEDAKRFAESPHP